MNLDGGDKGIAKENADPKANQLLATRRVCSEVDPGIEVEQAGRVQPARSWRASGEGQISLSASAERAFANFRDKKHRILQLQIFRTKNVFLETKNVVFLQLHENGHFHGATFISDDLSVHYDSYILAHTVIGP